jgi:hypothetical protein
MGACAACALSCSDGVRLVVVEQGRVEAASGGGTPSATGGKPGVTSVAGNNAEAGKSEQPQAGNGGSAGGGSGGGSAGAMSLGMGGLDDSPAWEAKALYTASFASFFAPSQYVRHVAEKGFIGVVDTMVASERTDASFEVIPGMAEATCVSLRAVDRDGSFLRHAGSRIYLHAYDDLPLFRQDATFCVEAGMADPEGVTFRSYNFAQRVIHLRSENELWIDAVPDPVTSDFAAAATFYQESALSEQTTP